MTTPAAVGLLAALDSVPGLTDALIGLGIGTLVGKLAVQRLERRDGELTAVRIRQIEARWISFFVVIALLLRIVSELT